MAYSTARATVKAAKPHLNPFSSTSDRVTARAKPPEYLQASLLQRERESDRRERSEAGSGMKSTKISDISHVRYNY